jgi:hypothetical protein
MATEFVLYFRTRLKLLVLLINLHNRMATAKYIRLAARPCRFPGCPVQKYDAQRCRSSRLVNYAKESHSDASFPNEQQLFPSRPPSANDEVLPAPAYTSAIDCIRLDDFLCELCWLAIFAAAIYCVQPSRFARASAVPLGTFNLACNLPGADASGVSCFDLLPGVVRQTHRRLYHVLAAKTTHTSRGPDPNPCSNRWTASIVEVVPDHT